MTDLQEVSLEILKEFIRICKILGLRYCVVGGTCLGAVRHGGFIPWDDDIDVALPRPDYEKFLKEARNFCDKKFYIQNYKYNEEPDLIYVFTKMRNKHTTFIEKGCLNKKFNQGVYIDIFPLDGKNNTLGFWWRRKVLQYRLVSDIVARNFKRNMVSFALNFFSVNLGKARKKLESMYRKEEYDSSEYVVNYCGAWEKKEVMKREWLEPFISVPFETIEVNIPGNFDCYLKQLYGNYKQLPPENKRRSHHYTEIIDLQNPYTNYVKKENMENKNEHI